MRRSARTEVHDDDVEFGGRLLEDGLRVVQDQLQPRVAEGLRVLRQVLPAEAHHILVDVDHDAPLDCGVAEDLARGGALAAAPNVHRLRARVRQQRRVHQRLVVDVLVDLARLDQAIDQQCAAKGREIDDVDGLEFGLRRAQHRLEPIRDPQPRLQLLLDPLGHGGRGLSESGLRRRAKRAAG